MLGPGVEHWGVSVPEKHQATNDKSEKWKAEAHHLLLLLSEGGFVDSLLQDGLVND